MKKIGIVLNKIDDNTIVVFIKILKINKKQNIQYFKVKKILVDTSYFNPIKGNLIEITKTRPLSKKKNFIITRILNT